ncbi:DUF1302 family protein [Cupriavidus oxalaticus]|uniref:LysR family transcriptional regulator n=2 Tax=Cupriavidus oxalaticus TaxID=96344 RepID=A0A375G0B3_9BURK|nr:DUF1302 family protein [Cupriavidus oxalaticus]WQD84491.1 DUF1302 family protein [Cupriavidus oxalaticus]SPC06595.1 conserved exported hypothetical protein [Cupriavidus oxalaticus]SPC12425.1 conserved exported hypothetical protein [Cupriavidus oxalaticus]
MMQGGRLPVRRPGQAAPAMKCIPALLLGLGIGLAPATAMATNADTSQPVSIASTIAQASVAAEPGTQADEDSGFIHSFRFGGYARTWASWNLEDHPEIPQRSAGSLQMLRGSLSLNAEATTGPLKWKAIGRADKEVNTSYQRDLEEANRRNSPGGPGSNLMDQYDQVQLRELYVDMDPTERLHLRLGKQQVVWGETDFFHPTDLIHGFDYRWRSFLESDNDELRKPLWLINAKFDVPEADGSLQLVLRPGIDRERDIGNSYDLYGGRWAAQPYKGVDFLAPGFLNYDRRHPAGDTHNPTGGLRWTGLAGPVNYAISYLKTYKPDPVVNSAFAPYQKTPTGGLGDFIFPKMDVYDVSVSGQIPGLDAVVTGEVAYQRNVAYNVGSNFMNGALPGFGGIIRKDAVLTTLRFDKQLRLMEWLGTNQASFFSLQVFDTWLPGYKSSDDIVEQVGFGARLREHTTLLTSFIQLNYLNSRLNPGLAVGMDLSNGDAFVIPSVSFQIGNHWRLLAEADLFFPKHSRKPGQVESSTHTLGDFARNSQFMLRATYQF